MRLVPAPCTPAAKAASSVPEITKLVAWTQPSGPRLSALIGW